MNGGNPVSVLEAIHKDAENLDQIAKELYKANQQLDKAEGEWDEAYDSVMVDLEDEFGKAGRKSVPEHTAVSAARRLHRDKWIAYKQAKRRMERLQNQLHAKRSAISGRQSELNAERALGELQSGPQPQWSGEPA